MASPNRWSPIEWLAKPVPLWPGHSKVTVYGVTRDSPPGLIRYWLQLGRSANATRTGAKP